MGLFFKKLNPVQEEEIKGYAGKLRLIRSQYEQAFSIFRSEAQDLYLICRLALLEGRGLQDKEYQVSLAVSKRQLQYKRKNSEKQLEIEPLIEDAKKTIQKFKTHVMNMQAQLDSAQPADWYPKKYKMAHAFLNMLSKDMIQYSDAAASALNPPQPLKYDPDHGDGKLETFASSLNTMAVLSQRSLFPRNL